jgi:hypothetical protein
MMAKYTFKVYPKGMGREVWRVIEFAGDWSLDILCMDILHAFDFDSDHLYEFNMDNKLYGSRFSYRYNPYDGGPSTAVPVNELGLCKGQNFLLHYDFGDDWAFVIHVNKIEVVEGNVDGRVIRSKGTIQQYPDYDW